MPNDLTPKRVTLYDDKGRPVDLTGPDAYAVPHVYTFTGLWRGAYQTYFRERFDQAMRHSRENALAMRLDEHLQACLNERIRAVANLDWHVAPDNPKDPWQKAAAEGVTKIIRTLPRRRRVKKQLSKAIWFGRYGVQCKWAWRDMDLPKARLAAVPEPVGSGEARGRGFGRLSPLADPTAALSPADQRQAERTRALTLHSHLPVNGDKIGFTWDHEPMIQIYPGETEGFPEDLIVTDNISRSLILRDRQWREQFLIHTYDPDDPDFYYGDMADAVHGLGIRNWLYWSWWTKTEFITSVADALERFGVGFIAIYFTAGNQAEEKEADALARNYTRKSVLKVPRPAGGRDSSGVEVVEIPTAGLQVLQELRQACELREERFIVAQTGSSRSETSGLGTHSPDFMQNTKYDLIRDDAEELAETLTGSPWEPGLVWMIQHHTYPWADFPLRFEFNVADPGAKDRLESVKACAEIGVDFVKDQVRELTGLSKPEPEDETVGGKEAMDALAPKPLGGKGGFGKGKGKEEEEEGGRDGETAEFGWRGEPLEYWNPSQSRGQPDNAGQFGPGGFGHADATPRGAVAARKDEAGGKGGGAKGGKKGDGSGGKGADEERRKEEEKRSDAFRKRAAATLAGKGKLDANDAVAQIGQLFKAAEEDGAGDDAKAEAVLAVAMGFEMRSHVREHGFDTGTTAGDVIGGNNPRRIRTDIKTSEENGYDENRPAKRAKVIEQASDPGGIPGYLVIAKGHGIYWHPGIDPETSPRFQKPGGRERRKVIEPHQVGASLFDGSGGYVPFVKLTDRVKSLEDFKDADDDTIVELRQAFGVAIENLIGSRGGMKNMEAHVAKQIEAYGKKDRKGSTLMKLKTDRKFREGAEWMLDKMPDDMFESNMGMTKDEVREALAEAGKK